MRGLLFAAALAATAAAAGPAVNPAIVYSTGGKFDASFNESAAAGASAWATETGASVAEFEPRDVGQMAQALRRFADQGRDQIGRAHV